MTLNPALRQSNKIAIGEPAMSIGGEIVLLDVRSERIADGSRPVEL